MNVGASARSRLYMAATQAGDSVVSIVPDIGQLPLDSPMEMGEIEYVAVMRLDVLAGESTGVSAFNSSI